MNRRPTTRSGPRRCVIASLVSVMLAAVACSGGEGDDDGLPSTTAGDATTSTGVAGISEEEAIEIARAQVEADDPAFDFRLTRPVVVSSGDTFDVSFPETELEGRGGEPHVVVDQATGDVVDTFLTR